MKKNSQMVKKVFFMVISIMLGATLAIGGEKLPEKLQVKIEEAFPGSKITKVEEETWEGQVVTEVELNAKDGTPYEVFLSQEGKVLKIEKEESSWFGN